MQLRENTRAFERISEPEVVRGQTVTATALPPFSTTSSITPKSS